MYMRDLGWGCLLPGYNVHERFRVGLSVTWELRDLGWGYLLPGQNVHERFRVGLSLTWA